MLRGGFVAACLATAAACEHSGGSEVVADPAGAPLAASRELHFSLRGRLASGPRLTVAVDAREGPVQEAVLRRAARWAAEGWSALAPVELELVDEPEQAAVVIAWRTDPHAGCVPFLADGAIAHTGPMPRGGAGTFVHLDASLRWHEVHDADRSLRQALLHELGHVLGLGHSLDPAAVMHAEPDARRSTPSGSDRAGLATLYGGLSDGPGDLLVLRDDGSATAHCALRRVLAPGISGWTAFDVDGDGSTEVLTWRSEEAGHGRVQVFHFSDGPLPERTLGPLWGVVVAGSALLVARDAGGRSLLVDVLADGRLRTLDFDRENGFTVRAPVAGLELEAGAADRDGDGVLDEQDSLAELLAPLREARADLDGDGRLERVLAR